jgi:hypothetical protein
MLSRATLAQVFVNTSILLAAEGPARQARVTTPVCRRTHLCTFVAPCAHMAAGRVQDASRLPGTWRGSQQCQLPNAAVWSCRNSRDVGRQGKHEQCAPAMPAAAQRHPPAAHRTCASRPTPMRCVLHAQAAVMPAPTAAPARRTCQWEHARHATPHQPQPWMCTRACVPSRIAHACVTHLCCYRCFSTPLLSLWPNICTCLLCRPILHDQQICSSGLYPSTAGSLSSSLAIVPRAGASGAR